MEVFALAKTQSTPRPCGRWRIALWSGYSVNDVQEDGEVLRIARLLNEKGVKKLDSWHAACAIVAKADYFLTTDNGILNKAMLVDDIKVTDPIGFIREMPA